MKTLEEKLKLEMHKIIIYFAFILLFIPKTFCQELIELKLPETDKITIKLMFKNGSVSDPVGKEGLTHLTSNLIISGGTENLTYNQIQEIIYPMAAELRTSVDKEVTVFTFNIHKDFLEDFYPIIMGLILKPSFTEKIIKGSNQINKTMLTRLYDHHRMKNTVKRLLKISCSGEHDTSTWCMENPKV